jgi:hypothetical protein
VAQRRELDAADARSVQIPNEGPGWFIPGATGACLQYDGGMACGPTTNVDAGHLGLVLGGPTETMVGMVPDGTKVSISLGDGSVESLPVNDNTFGVSTTSTNPITSVTRTSASGVKSSIAIPPGVA